MDAFYLEFDDERSGNFEPLKYVAEGKKVVLGLVTTKNPRLEDKQTIIARIHEAPVTSRWIACVSAPSAALPAAKSATS